MENKVTRLIFFFFINTQVLKNKYFIKTLKVLGSKLHVQSYSNPLTCVIEACVR